MTGKGAKAMRGTGLSGGPSRSSRKLGRMRLLRVEDDPELASILEAGFREQGIQVVRAATMPAGRDEAMRAAFDVIVLYVMLPGGSGIDLCQIGRASCRG